ncbi:FAD:protein FMN transferase [Granulicella tundricola]|uniref:FAD:protein FMN transferase n=1 Tax=Granulicella tundricola (strain ATCC BAA-1859 / DSM 23138 / MP5ACTX9) TaxID=1198114 RepID=E8WZZ6_GRATM|nr:FAD:protein FMN transferase [Granulicella tundricola]ADW68892.1 ApbE family lipoprotein [Granulicella tundricola MP5ACTX9]
MGWMKLSGVLLALGMVGALPGQEGLQRFHEVHRAMGTEFSIDLYARDEEAAGAAAEAAFDEVDRLEELLSNYRPSSELSRIGREAGAGTVTTDPETFRFLERAVFWSKRSDGAFDITVGPLLRAWGFYEHGGRIPSDAELKGLRGTLGWERIRLGAADRSVRFVPGRALDLDPGSIGKGFAVDGVVTVLREAGVRTALISAGGSTVYGMGAPPGTEGWPVTVMDPRVVGRVASTVMLKDMSLSSGACTQKFFIKDGHRYCHIFDPLTMRPVEGVLQTTVVSESATDSDALSTVVFVLPPERARAVLKPFGSVRALIFLNATTPESCISINWPGGVCAPSTTTK